MASAPTNIDAVLFFLAVKIYPSADLRDSLYLPRQGPRKSWHWQLMDCCRRIAERRRPFFDSVKLSVAPLRFGAASKKDQPGMAFGVPVVATRWL
jgi:hypothetical protein